MTLKVLGIFILIAILLLCGYYAYKEEERRRAEIDAREEDKLEVLCDIKTELKKINESRSADDERTDK